VALGDPWETIFTDLGVTFQMAPKILMGTDPGHPRVHSCPALLPIFLLPLDGGLERGFGRRFEGGYATITASISRSSFTSTVPRQ